MKVFWILLFTIVITDPYADLEYGEIDVYEYDNEDRKSKTAPRKKRQRKRDRYKKKKKIWCWMCSPPRWIYRK